jgi:hypothetical protein
VCLIFVAKPVLFIVQCQGHLLTRTAKLKFKGFVKCRQFTYEQYEQDKHCKQRTITVQYATKNKLQFYKFFIERLALLVTLLLSEPKNNDVQ